MSINIFGVVGEDVRASDVIPKIQAESGDVIEVNIMSPGGSVVEGLAIYDTLRASDRKILTRAMGQAASIASVIFMAGDEREVADNAEIMIHNAWAGVAGSKHELAEYVERLDDIDQKLINIYSTRSNLNEDQVRDLLDKETFMVIKGDFRPLLETPNFISLIHFTDKMCSSFFSSMLDLIFFIKS